MGMYTNKDIDKLLDAKHDEQEEERSAKRWEPEPGETISGVIMRVGWYDGGEYDPSMFLVFKDIDKDEVRRVWVKTVLQRQLTEEAPAIGQHIAIRYDGRETSNTGRKYHNYTLVLVPDESGEAKRDHAFWRVHGTYQGVTRREERAVAAAELPEDERFF